MKRLIPIILSVLILFSIAGCTKNEVPVESSTEPTLNLDNYVTIDAIGGATFIVEKSMAEKFDEVSIHNSVSTATCDTAYACGDHMYGIGEKDKYSLYVEAAHFTGLYDAFVDTKTITSLIDRGNSKGTLSNEEITEEGNLKYFNADIELEYYLGKDINLNGKMTIIVDSSDYMAMLIYVDNGENPDNMLMIGDSLKLAAAESLQEYKTKKIKVSLTAGIDIDIPSEEVLTVDVYLDTQEAPISYPITTKDNAIYNGVIEIPYLSEIKEVKFASENYTCELNIEGDVIMGNIVLAS